MTSIWKLNSNPKICCAVTITGQPSGLLPARLFFRPHREEANCTQTLIAAERREAPIGYNLFMGAKVKREKGDCAFPPVAGRAIWLPHSNCTTPPGKSDRHSAECQSDHNAAPLARGADILFSRLLALVGTASPTGGTGVKGRHGLRAVSNLFFEYSGEYRRSMSKRR